MPSTKCYSCGEVVSLHHEIPPSSVMFSIGSHTKKYGGLCHGGTLKTGTFKGGNEIEWLKDPLWKAEGRGDWVLVSRLSEGWPARWLRALKQVVGCK